MKILIPILFLCGAATSYWWPLGAKRNQEPSNQPTNTNTSPSRSGNRFTEDIEFHLQAIRDARNPREQALAVAELAARLPVHEIEDWINKGCLRFLDNDLEELFRTITTQRWMEEDPATIAHFQVEKGWSSSTLTPYFEAWVKADPEAAVAYVRSQQHRNKSIQSAVALAVALAQTDVLTALALIDEIRSRWSAQLSWKEPLLRIARQDPQAVLQWIDRLPPNARKTGVSAVATAALETDFAWSIALLQREGLGWEGLKDARPNTSSLFLANLDKLPPEWITPLASTLTHGNEIAWLELREHEFLTSAQLKLIHEQAADRFYDLVLRPD